MNATRDPAARYGRPPRRTPDDTGGVWILTGIVLGLLVYAGMVLMLVAGFSGVAPLVVIPPVLLALIAANNLLGGGRTHGRSPGRPVGQGQAPLSSSGPNGAAADAAPPPGDAVTEGPSGAR
ncbi:MAG: hypothetical protein ABSC90_06265 [Acidimicrobiales bacterium]